MIQNNTVVCLAQSNYWNDVPYPIHHMMKAMCRYNRVLWVNPTSVAFPSVKKRIFLSRVVRRLKSHMRYFVKVHPNMYVFSPIIIPVFTKETTYKINEKLLYYQLKLVFSFMRIKHPYMFVSLPTFAKVALALPSEKLLYYISDKYSGYEHVINEQNKKIIEQLNQLLIRKSDYLLFTAWKLYDDIDEDSRRKSFLIPHGVDLKLIQKTIDEHNHIPKDLSGIKKPIVGYFGTLFRERCNMEIVRWCAKRRPEWSFIFIGRKWDDFPELKKLKNVHFLGPKPHYEIPIYGKHFDVCIISRYMNEAVRYSNPTKINEFLALGKPIVSVPIDHLMREYSAFVSIARNKHEFLERMEFEIKNDSQEKIEKRMARVRNYSYEKMVEFISAFFEDDTERARHFFN